MSLKSFLVIPILLFITAMNPASEAGDVPFAAENETEQVEMTEITDSGTLAPDNQEEPKKLVLVAGRPSHSTGTHEFNAGVLLFDRCLESVDGLDVHIQLNGWPDDESLFDDADAVVLFMDGGGRHPVVQDDRLELMDSFVENGISFAAMHYGVEVPAENGGPEFQEWIGGYYETYYSANPIWTANFEEIPDHPVTRGVQPFSAEDEWYFSIRFRPDMEGITPLLTAVPSDDTRDGPYVSPRGPYDHIVARKGEPEVMSWVVEREDGGRGFGFTGGHFHNNWGNDNYRKYALNAFVWLSGAEVPANGVECVVTDEQLLQNLDE